MAQWTVVTHWFPYALSTLTLDLAKAIQMGTGPGVWEADGRVRIPMADSFSRIYEVRDDSVVIAWDEDRAGKVAFPSTTYYRIGLVRRENLQYLLAATVASRLATMHRRGEHAA